MTKKTAPDHLGVRFPQGVASEVSRLDQYLGLWAIIDDRFQEVLSQIAAMDLAAHIEAASVRVNGKDMEPSPGGYEVQDGVAFMTLHGAMTKYGSSLSQMPGTLQIRKDLRDARTDKSVEGVMLAMDSPGGTVNGISDLADEVRAFAKSKPLAVHAEDTLASAAYWTAANATQISASPGAMVGSIGAYTVVDDLSGINAENRVKTYVVRSGDYKGIGVPGAEVTPEQLAEVQRMVDDVSDIFVKAVQDGRSLAPSRARALADGRVHVASDAKGLGLLDKVETFDRAVRGLRDLLPGKAPTRSNRTRAAVALMG